jgi:predicted nucleotidyltransferase
MVLLIKTELRRKLLSYTFTHLDEHYYVRELASLITVDPGNLSRELSKLENEGLFSSSVRGRTKYFSINKQYPLYKEIKKIILKTEGMEGSLKSLVDLYKGISVAFIYGSYAKNRENRTSDIDLIVVGQIPHHDFTRDIRYLEARLDREVNFTIYNEEEFRIEKEKQGVFLNLVLKEKIVMIKGEL